MTLLPGFAWRGNGVYVSALKESSRVENESSQADPTPRVRVRANVCGLLSNEPRQPHGTGR